MRYRVHQAGLPEAGPPLGLGMFRRWAGYLGQPARILRSYRREFVTPDVIAGLTVAMVALPQAIAYASIADLPPHFGLYAAIVAAIVGSLWGSSHHLSTGPTNAASILMLSVLAPMIALGTPEYLVAASVMALLVGGFRILFGFAGLGVLINFVSRAVLVGFTAGAAILIAVNQLPTLLGLHTGPSRGTFATLGQVHRHLADTNTAALTIGLGVAALTLVVNRFLPRLPGALIALITASAVVGWRGAEQLGVAVVGDLPSPLPQLTDFQAATSFFTSGLAGEMLTGALAISLLGLVEAISIARTISRSSGQRLDVNQEFVGQGLSN
ncbi:MAG: SulP family inorganic anion transporter, partial [Acidobacteriota bacterium]